MNKALLYSASVYHGLLLTASIYVGILLQIAHPKSPQEMGIGGGFILFTIIGIVISYVALFFTEDSRDDEVRAVAVAVIAASQAGIALGWIYWLPTLLA